MDPVSDSIPGTEIAPKMVTVAIGAVIHTAICTCVSAVYNFDIVQ